MWYLQRQGNDKSRLTNKIGEKNSLKPKWQIGTFKDR
jgi:hypothetical protein